MSRDPGCIFCKIVHGEIPSARVLETDQAVVILDVNPIASGHLLILPKDHHPQVRDLPDDLAGHLGSLLPRLTRALIAVTGAEGSNTVVNTGAVAGQTVFHCHWHVIPRFAGDAVNWPWPQGRYTGDELAQTAARLVQALEPEAI